MRSITAVKDLESIVGSIPQASMMKSIDHLDSRCVAILAQAPVTVVGYVGAGGERRAGVAGGSRGFIEIVSPDRLKLPLALDVTPTARSGVSMCFLLPGIGEPLRVNGRYAGSDDETVIVDVQEAFVHCGKCVHRAKLWDEPGAHGVEIEVPVYDSGPFADPDVAAFLVSSPFAVFTTWGDGDTADASPKGDPDGFIQVLDERTIAIPDRKGNRRTDTFHNIVANPELAMITLVPGDERALEINGTAFITDDRDIVEPMAIQGSIPKVALIVTVERARLQPSPAIVGAGLWNPDNHLAAGDVPNLMKVAAAHAAKNKSGGLLAGLTRTVSRAAATAIPDGVVQVGQNVVYERDLY